MTAGYEKKRKERSKLKKKERRKCSVSHAVTEHDLQAGAINQFCSVQHRSLIEHVKIAYKIKTVFCIG